MRRGATHHDWRHDSPEDRAALIRASLLALLFAVLTMVSFAIDQGVTLSTPRTTPAMDAGRR